MKRSGSGGLLAAALLLTGCGGGPVGPADDPADAVDSAASRARQRADEWLTLAREDAWTYYRAVRRCGGPHCAFEGSGWRVQRLFDEVPGVPPSDHGEAEPFYLLEWAAPRPGDGLDEQHRAAADAIRGWSQQTGALLPEALYEPRAHPLSTRDAAAKLRETATRHWQRLGGFLEVHPPRPSATNRVTVHVLDTHPPGVGRYDPAATRRADREALVQAGHSLHGLMVAEVVRRAACGEDLNAECAVEVQTAVALDLVAASAEQAGDGEASRQGGYAPRPEGGHFGDPGGVARAVWRAVAEWSGRPRDQREAKMLVLALGWTGKRGSEATDAAALAIRYARCAGAVVVSAYGNRDRPDHPDGEGPLLPAGFRDEGRDCLGRALAAPALAAAGVTLAPDGATLHWQPLPDGRPWGSVEPDVLAWGEGVILPEGPGRWSGSSVAAATYAGTLAARWAEHADRAGRPAGQANSRSLAAELQAEAEGQHFGVTRPCAARRRCEALQPPVSGPVDRTALRQPPALSLPAACGAPGQPQPCRGGPALELADPQPDDPICEVCSLVAIGGQPHFILQAQHAPWPAKYELVRDVKLKVTYWGGAYATHYLTLYNDAQGTELGVRYDLAGTPFQTSTPLQLNGPLTQVKTVVVVGLLDHDTYDEPRTFVESGSVDP